MPNLNEYREKVIKWSKDELLNARINVIKNSSQEHLDILETELDKRFPSWEEEKVNARGGSTPTEAVFQGKKEFFPNGKEAYIWLINQLLQVDENAINKYLSHFGNPKNKGNKFARERRCLFREGSIRRAESKYCACLDRGWFADINLNHKHKYDTLLNLFNVCGYVYVNDWDFKVTGATSELISSQNTQIKSNEILSSFRKNREGRN